jgi:beta-glucosidase
MTSFPAGFLWGTSTAAYQIEGAVDEGGRGPSIWDTFSHTPGKTVGGETGDVACDHYHRYAEDVRLMAQLGTGAYRFSVSWSRLQPAGRGPLNPEGVAFYDRLLDELAAAGITPWVTLYHWDLPQPLEDAGGWPVRDTAHRFADYAAAVHQHFADRVGDWLTLNEPWCSAFLGYYNGVHAPGRTDLDASLRAMHHLLLGHGLATDAMRSAKPQGRYGISLNLYPVDPLTDSFADLDAARRVDGVCNRLFTDPVLGGGHYPDDVVADLGEAWPGEMIHDGDAELLATPIDMLGINYYTRHVVFGDDDLQSTTAFAHGWVGCEGIGSARRGYPVTTMDWEIDPVGLYDDLTRLRGGYPNLPTVYITENGAAFDDVVEPDGRVRDAARVDYLREHFVQARRAIDEGVPLAGYFVWSLLDNFEWSFGTTRRFGVVHVDFGTQRRTIKDSGRFLAQVASSNAVPPARG